MADADKEMDDLAAAMQATEARRGDTVDLAFPWWAKAVFAGFGLLAAFIAYVVITEPDASERAQVQAPAPVQAAPSPAELAASAQRQAEAAQRQAEQDAKFDAYQTCTAELRRVARFPSKVDCPFLPKYHAEKKADGFVVVGICDMMTPAGAEVPHTFYCTLKSGAVTDFTVQPGG